MAARIKVRIVGADKTALYFGRLPKHIVDALDEAVKKSAFLVERESKIVTPVLTGRLRSSIFTTLKPLRATVQPKTDYALAVHEGTGRMRARPYMKWGLDRAKNEIGRIFSKEIKKATR